MTKDWRPYAEHVLECVEKIDYILQQGSLLENSIFYDAVLRNLQTLSEATRHLPEEYIRNYPQIPWKNISGFRNILVHDYLGKIDAETILTIVHTHLPPLRQAVEQILKK